MKNDITLIFKNGKITVNGKEFEKEDFHWNLSGGYLTIQGTMKGTLFSKPHKVTIRNNDYSIIHFD